MPGTRCPAHDAYGHAMYARDATNERGAQMGQKRSCRASHHPCDGNRCKRAELLAWSSQQQTCSRENSIEQSAYSLAAYWLVFLRCWAKFYGPAKAMQQQCLLRLSSHRPGARGRLEQVLLPFCMPLNFCMVLLRLCSCTIFISSSREYTGLQQRVRNNQLLQLLKSSYTVWSSTTCAEDAAVRPVDVVSSLVGLSLNADVWQMGLHLGNGISRDNAFLFHVAECIWAFFTEGTEASHRIRGCILARLPLIVFHAGA